MHVRHLQHRQSLPAVIWHSAETLANFAFAWQTLLQAKAAAAESGSVFLHKENIFWVSQRRDHGAESVHIGRSLFPLLKTGKTHFHLMSLTTIKLSIYFSLVRKIYKSLNPVWDHQVHINIQKSTWQIYILTFIQFTLRIWVTLASHLLLQRLIMQSVMVGCHPKVLFSYGIC